MITHRNPELSEQLQEALTAAGVPASGANAIVSRELARRLEGSDLSDPKALLRAIYVMTCDMSSLAERGPDGCEGLGIVQDWKAAHA